MPQSQGMMPRAKVRPAPVPEAQVDPWDVDGEEDPELFELCQGAELMPEIEPMMPAQTMNHLETRMSQVEGALQKIINYIEQNSTTLISEQ